VAVPELAQIVLAKSSLLDACVLDCDCEVCSALYNRHGRLIVQGCTSPYSILRARYDSFPEMSHMFEGHAIQEYGCNAGVLLSRLEAVKDENPGGYQARFGSNDPSEVGYCWYLVSKSVCCYSFFRFRNTK
jgi:hypothetical protein